MTRTIPIVDLMTGAVSLRASDTGTLDLPDDFDAGTGAAAFDGRALASYRSQKGGDVSAAARPRPLSSRAPGEECLVADETSASRFSPCEIEPVD